MKRIYIFITISIILLFMLGQQAIAYNPELFDTTVVYDPYYIVLIDSANTETTWVKPLYIQTPYLIVDSGYIDTLWVKRFDSLGAYWDTLGPVDSAVIATIADSALKAVYAWNSDKLDNVSLENITWSDVNMATGDVNMDDITPANASLNMNTDYYIENVKYISVTIQDTLLIEFGYNSGYGDFIPLLPKVGAGLLINNEFGYDFSNNKWVLDGAFEFEDDGAGCGFDADLLDGYSEDYFLDTNDVVGGLTGHDSTNFLYSDTIDIGEFISVLGTKVFEVNLDSNYIYIGEGAGSGAGRNDIFIGKDAGKSYHSDGLYNIGIGSYALYLDTIGDYNVAIGYVAMGNNTSGSYNAAIGYKALEENTTGIGNFAIGSQALNQCIDGENNVGIGKEAGMWVGHGGSKGCMAIGYQALYSDSIGNHNVGIGHQVGHGLTLGTGNVFIGYRNALSCGIDPDYNVAIGYRSGYNVEGDFNIFLGYQTGYSLTNVSNQLHIAMSNTDTLIYGEFDNHYVFIKDSVYIPQLVTDDIYLGGGETVVKFTKIGSHLAIVLNNDVDTFWIAADTTGF